jgi:methionyl-tRNA formyltransferase
MRIVLVGSKTAACDVACELREHLVLIVGEADQPWQKSLEDTARQLGVPYTIHWDDALAERDIDYVISVQAARIFKPADLELASFINIHFGKLPQYRGCNPIYHAIINGEAYAHVTAHFIDEGIDTGPVIDSRKVIIGKKTAREVFDALTLMSAPLMRAILPQMVAGAVWSTKQDEDYAAYYPKDAVDFYAESRRFRRMSRALAFPPFQNPGRIA